MSCWQNFAVALECCQMFLGAQDLHVERLTLQHQAGRVYS